MKNKYCRSGNIREVLIFARETNSRFQESRENYHYNSTAKHAEEKWKFKDSKIISLKKSEICENSNTRKLPDIQYLRASGEAKFVSLKAECQSRGKLIFQAGSFNHYTRAPATTNSKWNICATWWIERFYFFRHMKARLLVYFFSWTDAINVLIACNRTTSL